MITISRNIPETSTSDKFFNTTLFVYADTVENYEVVGSGSTITTTNAAALSFAERFFSESSNQRLILKSTTSSYENAIENVGDSFLYCCTDAKNGQLEDLLAYCAGKSFLLIFFLPVPSLLVVPSADNLVAVVTGYTEVNYLSTLYPVVSTIELASNLSDVLGVTSKALVGFSTEEVSSSVVVNDVTSAFYAPNRLALNEIIFIINQQTVRYATLELKVSNLSGLLSLLRQLEADFLAAPEGEQAAIQAAIDSLKVDINVLLVDIFKLIDEIQQANADINALLALITATLPEDVSAAIIGLLSDIQALVDTALSTVASIESAIQGLETGLIANVPATGLIPIIANVPTQIDTLETTSQAIVTAVDSILAQVAFINNDQLESLSSNLLVLDVVQERVLVQGTMEVELLQSSVAVQDMIRDQILISNTMEVELLQSSITVQDIVRT